MYVGPIRPSVTGPFKNFEKPKAILNVKTNDRVIKSSVYNLLHSRFVISMVYYGLSLNSTDLGLNEYLDFFLVVSADIVGIAICYYTVEKWGRVLTICVSMIMGGALCIATGWMGEYYCEQNISMTTMSMSIISRIRMFLDESACHHAVRALITSKLDYANSILLGLSAADINRLQRIQNRAAKLVFKTQKRDHTSPYLKQLHWLPIKSTH